jgi:hypothetical protein
MEGTPSLRFYIIGNYEKSTSPFALFGHKKNYDRREAVGGDTPLIS